MTTYYITMVSLSVLFYQNKLSSPYKKNTGLKLLLYNSSLGIRLVRWPIPVILLNLPVIFVSIIHCPCPSKLKNPNWAHCLIVAYVKLCQMMAGLYMWVCTSGCLALSFCDATGLTRIHNTRWEFFTTLDYEWHVIQGRVRYRWTLWVCIYRHLSKEPLSFLDVTPRLNLTYFFLSFG